MMRKRGKNRSRRNYLRRLFSATNRGWILDPILSEREEWSECVRAKGRNDEEEHARETEPDERSDEFDE